MTVVYSCSGCSNVAQLANSIAVHLDRNNLATMSCIAGIGADIPSLVKIAKDANPILVLDGCPIACALKCLKRHDIHPAKHIILTQFGLRKSTLRELSDDDKNQCKEMVIEELNHLTNYRVKDII